MPVFDIETGPLEDRERVLSFADPFQKEIPSAFDPASVKLGNLKDEAKIQAKIEKAREAFEAEVAKLREEKAGHENAIIERAALSASTGCVLAIGVCSSKGPAVLTVESNTTEAILIHNFWTAIDGWIREGRPLVGHHISFDVTFLVRRSWILGVDIPRQIVEDCFNYRSKIFGDTEERWLLGQRFGNQKSNLDYVAKSLGIKGKLGGKATLPGIGETELGGKTFHLFFRAGGQFREMALNYLKEDLRATYEVAQKLGFVMD